MGGKRCKHKQKIIRKRKREQKREHKSDRNRKRKTNEASFLRGERSYYVNDEPLFQGFYHFAFREHERWLSINSTLPVYELQLYAFLSSE